MAEHGGRELARTSRYRAPRPPLGRGGLAASVLHPGARSARDPPSRPDGAYVWRSLSSLCQHPAGQTARAQRPQHAVLRRRYRTGTLLSIPAHRPPFILLCTTSPSPPPGRLTVPPSAVPARQRSRAARVEPVSAAVRMSSGQRPHPGHGGRALVLPALEVFHVLHPRLRTHDVGSAPHLQRPPPRGAGPPRHGMPARPPARPPAPRPGTDCRKACHARARATAPHRAATCAKERAAILHTRSGPGSMGMGPIASSLVVCCW